MIRHSVAGLLVASFCLGASATGAMACSCERPPAEVRPEAYPAWTFKRAKNVVKGTIVSVRGGEEPKLDGKPMVTVGMNVKEVLKGDAATGEVTLVTGFGNGDCGLGPALLAALGGRNELSIEVYTATVPNLTPLPAKQYFVHLCGHAHLSPGTPAAQQ